MAAMELTLICTLGSGADGGTDGAGTLGVLRQAEGEVPQGMSP